MSRIEVRYEGGDRLRMAVRGHEIVLDQPVEDGGGDLGPTPTELFVGGLAACVGFYAERFLRRHGLPLDGLAVECEFSFSTDRPARVSEVELRVLLPAGFPDERREGLRAVVEHCTVHNSIRQAPEVRIELASGEGAPSR
jgi:uncharacterized OsmC-like protein